MAVVSRPLMYVPCSLIQEVSMILARPPVSCFQVVIVILTMTQFCLSIGPRDGKVTSERKPFCSLCFRSLTLQNSTVRLTCWSAPCEQRTLLLTSIVGMNISRCNTRASPSLIVLKLMSQTTSEGSIHSQMRQYEDSFIETYLRI